MDWTTPVTVHESAAPTRSRERILASLQRNELDPAVLYGGLRQTLKWIDLHRAFSPAQQDPACAAIYESAFQAAAQQLKGNVAHVISAACGDGTKDLRCLKILRETGRAALYTPIDISLDMVLAARETAAAAFRGLQITPLLCELERCSILPAILKHFDPSGADRLILLLGILPNFWPPTILRPVLFPLRPQDQLLVSANMAPTGDYQAALQRILPQYDNEPTRAWLAGAVAELNLGPLDGDLAFSLQPSDLLSSLWRVQADFVFRAPRIVRYFDAEIPFAAGAKLRLLISQRFTAEHVRDFLRQAGLTINAEFITPSGEEGLFLARRESSAAQ